MTPFFAAGWIVLAVVALFAIFAILSNRRRRQLIAATREREVNGLTQEVLQLRAERERSSSPDSETGWKGYAPFVVFRKHVHAESGICSFYLKPKDTRLKLASFHPGQHLVFQLPTQGEFQPLIRRYSLSDAPNENYYRISVKRLPAPTDQPEVGPGRGSSFLHEHVDDQEKSRENCHLLVGAPQGSFHLNPNDTTPVVLIGGGVGVTPMLSMFNSIVETNPSREVWFFYGVRHSGEDILDEDGILSPKAQSQLAERQNLQLRIHYSKPLERDTILLDGNPARYRRGRVNIGVLKEALPSSQDYRFYICGPEEMMDQLENDLEDWGAPPNHIFSERFGPPTRKPTPGLGKGEVAFVRSGTSIGFSDEDACLLDTAERAGVAIANECRAGSCGSCVVSILSGEVTYPRKTAFKPKAGTCLTCSCVPKSDIVLDC